MARKLLLLFLAAGVFLGNCRITRKLRATSREGLGNSQRMVNSNKE